MKKIITLLSLFLLITVSSSVVHAASIKPTNTPTASSSASPTPNSDLVNKINQQITKLKDQIASRVAQLNLVEKRGIIGTLVEVNGNTEMQIKDIHGNIRILDVDELTKFSSPSAQDNFGISDITKGTVIGVLGNYNRESQHLLARFVDVLTLPQIVSGAITSLDKKNYTFTIATVDKGTLIINVESVTKTYTYTQADGLKKAGFSKLAVGDRVFVVGFTDIKIANQINASRITRFSELPVDPSLANQVSLTPTPSALTPSPTPSPTLTPTKKKSLR